MLNYIRKAIKKSSLIREFVAFKLAPSGYFDKIILNKKLNKYWDKRLNETVECPDNNHIPRVTNAGEVINGKQIMHNGIKIHLGSYYGPEVAQVLKANRGVHEPQEERIFAEVLKAIPENANMIEMGSFWSFYSMWFNKEIVGARNFMIEPEQFNLKCGFRNFELNNMIGDFTQAFIGKESKDTGTRTVCVDDFVNEKDISHIHLLHSDIQGFEYDMLLGAEKTINASKVDFIFISTHSNGVHQKCLKFLKKKRFHIKADIDMENTYSEDGLIVAQRERDLWTEDIALSKKEKLAENNVG